MDYLRLCHREAPFLFFNGNTFAEIARTFSDFLFAEFSLGRRRTATSVVAHYVAGVLDQDALAPILEALAATASYVPGDRVCTLRGSMHGTVISVEQDGRLVWRTDQGSELISLPEALLHEAVAKTPGPTALP